MRDVWGHPAITRQLCRAPQAPFCARVGEFPAVSHLPAGIEMSGFAAQSRPSVPRNVVARSRLRTRSNSPTGLLDVSEKPRASLRTQPPAVGARKIRRPYPADYILRGSPSKRRQPRDRKTRRRIRRLCFTRNEAASPARSTDVLIGIAGWRRLLGLRSRPRSGGYCIVLQAHLSARRGRAPLQTENRGFCRGISLSDAGSIPRIVTRVR